MRIEMSPKEVVEKFVQAFNNADPEFLASVPAMLDNGSGAIVNMSSANGFVGLAGMSAYTAAKLGVIGLTRSAALELAESNIRVRAVAPDYVATPRIMDSGR
jgi:NAD(P)-dependent dehydrogenase (short-subunit alcohol dehydrogenase family)